MPLAEIGIWIDTGEQIVVRKQTALSGRHHNGLIETHFSHEDGRLAIDSPDVCRGRVAIDASTWEGIIYHCGRLPPQRLPAIAAQFCLSQWRAVAKR